MGNDVDPWTGWTMGKLAEWEYESGFEYEIEPPGVRGYAINDDGVEAMPVAENGVLFDAGVAIWQIDLNRKDFFIFFIWQFDSLMNLLVWVNHVEMMNTQ